MVKHAGQIWRLNCSSLKNDVAQHDGNRLVHYQGNQVVHIIGYSLVHNEGNSTGSAVSRDLVSLAMAKNAVGTAWASSNDAGLKRVNVAVGIGLGGNGARDIASVNAKTNKLEAESAAKDQKINKLEQDNAAKAKELAAIKARLDKIEKALNSK